MRSTSRGKFDHGQRRDEAVVRIVREAIRGGVRGQQVKNGSGVRQGVSPRGEGERSLARQRAFGAEHQKRACVHDGGQAGKPGLIGMERPVIGEHRIGEVGLQ